MPPKKRGVPRSDSVSSLKRQKTDPGQGSKTGDGSADVWMAAFNGDAAAVAAWVKGPDRDVNALHPDRQTTLLYTAARAGHLKLVQMLLEAGCGIDKPNGRKGAQSTALHGAAFGGHSDIVALLIRKGAQQVPNLHGDTPLEDCDHSEAPAKDKDKCRKELMGAAPRVTSCASPAKVEPEAAVGNDSGSTSQPAGKVAKPSPKRGGRQPPKEAGQLQGVGEGEGKKCPLDCDKDLWAACLEGDLDRIKCIAKAEPGKLDTLHPTRQTSALYTAARAGHLPVVRYLVEDMSADVDRRNGQKGHRSTALHGAAYGGFTDIVEYLLKQHAVIIENIHGDTPLDDCYQGDADAKVLKRIVHLLQDASRQQASKLNRMASASTSTTDLAAATKAAPDQDSHETKTKGAKASSQANSEKDNDAASDATDVMSHGELSDAETPADKDKGVDTRPVCKYGKDCYRESDAHYKAFAHPWLESPGSMKRSSSSASFKAHKSASFCLPKSGSMKKAGSMKRAGTLPSCHYGKDCYRKDPEHFLAYAHPWLERSGSAAKKSSDDPDDIGDN